MQFCCSQNHTANIENFRDIKQIFSHHFQKIFSTSRSGNNSCQFFTTKKGLDYNNEREPRLRFSFVVGVPGFEPGTPCSQSRCANRTALHPECLCLIGVCECKVSYYILSVQIFLIKNLIFLDFFDFFGNFHCFSPKFYGFKISFMTNSANLSPKIAVV